MSFVLRNAIKKIASPVAFQYANSSFIHTGSRLLAPRVQHAAPDFKGVSVLNGEFKDIQLSDYTGKYLVLVFYPLDFTFVCPTELISFSERTKDFQEIGCEIVGISADSKFSHLAWTQLDRKDGGVGKLNFPLFADFNKEMAKAYDVLIEEEGIALRGMFIIDKKGILRQMTVNDLPVGRSVEETLRLVKAFQFADKHGEVCPANWNPDTNAATIKPDPKGSKEYFKKANK